MKTFFKSILFYLWNSESHKNRSQNGHFRHNWMPRNPTESGHFRYIISLITIVRNKALSFITYQNHVNTITTIDATRHRTTHVLTFELILNLTIVKAKQICSLLYGLSLVRFIHEEYSVIIYFHCSCKSMIDVRQQSMWP